MGRLTPERYDAAPAITALKKRFGIGKEIIKMYQHPYIYLDDKVIHEKGLDTSEVERAIAVELMKTRGIALAVSSSDLRAGRLPEAPMIRRIRRNFHPKRSGDSYLVQEPYWFLYSDESIPLCTIHGSPWLYDTYVPIFFAGADMVPQRVGRRVHPVDIAPTLSAVLGIKPPSGAAGDVLPEVFRESSAE